MRRTITLLLVSVTALLLMLFFWEIARWVVLFALALFGAALGLAGSLALFVFLSKFWLQQKNPRIALQHNPDRDAREGKVFLAVMVDENRAVAIERGGNPVRIIEGGANPADTMTIEEWQRRTALPDTDPDYFDPNKPCVYRLREIRSPILAGLLYDAFKSYEDYIYKATGLYVYVPLFTKPKVIPLPRYRVKPRDGKNIYIPVEEDDTGYNTNHVRTALTTWYFEFKGLDIEGVPFMVTGSIQYSIDRLKVRDALYKTDAWNVLLDQSAISVIRSTVRHDATIDKVVGTVGVEIWKAKRKSRADLFNVLAQLVFMNLKEFTFDIKPSDEHPDGKMKLEDVGINIHKVMFNDFDPELTAEELLQLRAPALQQRVARGQMAIGRATADNQQRLVDVHKDGGDASDRILAAEALVRASSGEGGKSTLLDTLIASFIQSQQKSK
jgi:hypothetical protein